MNRLNSLFLPILSVVFVSNTVFAKNYINIKKVNVSQGYIENETPQTKTIIASSISPGYNKQNSTACFVNAIKSAEKGDTVIIDKKAGTDGVWLIEGRHPNWFDGKRGKDRVANDVTLIFEEGVVLKAIDNTFDHPKGLDMLLRLENISGWRILGYGAKFEMNNIDLQTGEFMNAIALYDCSDINIEGLHVDGSGGDGIFIGSRTKTGYSKDISVKNMIFENHRRQGTTITSAERLRFENIKFNCTWGRPPRSGLDIEPDSVTQRVKDIKFKNVEFAYNGYTGILFALTKMNNTSIPIDVEFEDVYVRENWQAQGNLNPDYKKAAIVMSFGGGGNNAVQGSVIFNRVLIKNERFDGLFTLKHHDTYKLVFNDLVIENVGSDNAPDAKFAIHTSRYNYDAPTPAIGNIFFDGLFIRENRKIPFWKMEGDNDDGWSIDDLRINNSLIVTPNTWEQGIDNPTNARKGQGTDMDYRMTATIPNNTVDIKIIDSKIARGSSSSFVITRQAQDMAYPLSVEYKISGTAQNMDDYDLLHGYVIIPANERSAPIPINTREKNDKEETLTITLLNTPNYALGSRDSETLAILANQ